MVIIWEDALVSLESHVEDSIDRQVKGLRKNWKLDRIEFLKVWS